jgi:adenylate kinase
VAPSAINNPFSLFGPVAKTKVLLLNSPDVSSGWLNWARSLHIEHVSPAKLIGREISSEASALAPMRRWYFGRKPDAGFLLSDFPATLLHAKVFDEWLEARGEALDAVLGGRPWSPVAEHYRTLGLLVEDSLQPSELRPVSR